MPVGEKNVCKDYRSSTVPVLEGLVTDVILQ